MGTILEQLPRGARVLVIRLRSLGDCVLTTPALALLKRSRPDLEIGVVVEPRFAAVFEGNPDVTAVLPPAPGAVARWGARLCLNLHGGTRSALLTLASRARFRAGFAHHRCAFLYNVPIPRAQQILGVERKVHTAEHLASAVFYLGAERADIPRARLFSSARCHGRYAVLHPLASSHQKTWPASHFVALAGHLLETWNLEPVFIGGPGDDLRPFCLFRTLVGAPLAEVKDLLGCAARFIGNDSGPAHMAAAFGVPSVVLFGASDPAIWGPWKAPAEVLAARRHIGEVPVSEVLAAMDRLDEVPA